MKHDTLAFIGRFQPFHNGHKEVVDTALDRAYHVAIVLGSHEQPRSTRNPFTTDERIAMITAVYPEQVAAGRIVFVPQVDHPYNMDRWIAGVQGGVDAVTVEGGTIGLIGHSKDHSSFYLKCFPAWGSVEVPNNTGIDATTLRGFAFHGAYSFYGLVPEAVEKFVKDWQKSGVYRALRDEHDFIEGYKKQWENSPYPPTFVCADAVVVQSGHILLVKRAAAPGKGLWALPGGFVEQGETLRSAALRELREETRLAVPLPVLNGSIVRERTFDDPHRSQRGRTITTAFYIRLEDREDLPKVKGSEEAEKARWVPLSQLKRKMMFEDHFDIATVMTAF